MYRPWAALRHGRRGRDVARLVAALIRPLARYRWPPKLFPPATGQRKWAKLLGDTYDEWSVLYSPQSDVAQSSPELIDLAVRAATRARDVDLTGVAERETRDQERLAPVSWPGEHYRTLSPWPNNGDTVIRSPSLRLAPTPGLRHWRFSPLRLSRWLRPSTYGPGIRSRSLSCGPRTSVRGSSNGSATSPMPTCSPPTPICSPTPTWCSSTHPRTVSSSTASSLGFFGCSRRALARRPR